MACSSTSLTEIYRTAHGSVSQCNRQNCYWLDFAGERTAFRVRDFLAFKKKIDQIDLEAMVVDPSPGADYAVVMPRCTSRCFLLDISDILALRELLDGAKFMIELTQVLCQGFHSAAHHYLD